MEVSFETGATLVGEPRLEVREAVTLGGKLATCEMFLEGVEGTRFGAKVRAACIFLISSSFPDLLVVI